MKKEMGLAMTLFIATTVGCGSDDKAPPKSHDSAVQADAGQFCPPGQMILKCPSPGHDGGQTPDSSKPDAKNCGKLPSVCDGVACNTVRFSDETCNYVICNEDAFATKKCK